MRWTLVLGLSAMALVWANAKCYSNEGTFPVCSNVVDVTKPPYNATGDGIHDDTEALQKAINDITGLQRLLYIPPGTYLVSSTLTWPKKVGERENWGFTYIAGSDPRSCVIRLKDDTFKDSSNPRSIMWCGGFGSADWFHNYVENLTFDVGSGNAGAIALQFYSNNSGAIRNCIFRSYADSGHTGLDLAYRDMNGPLLVCNCLVDGFATGIHTANSVNGQVFENITIKNQRQTGFLNEGQTVSIRNLISDNEVTALSSYGTLCLIDGQLRGLTNASNVPATVNFNGGRMYLRDINTNGYRRALADIRHTPDAGAATNVQGPDKAGSEGPTIRHYSSHPIAMLFDSPSESMRLQVKETPTAVADAPESWANVDDFGADPRAEKDSSESIQRAVDSGATTIFLPGSYNVRKTVIIRNKVRRIVGLGGQINYGKGLAPDFKIEDGDLSELFIEHLAHIGGGIEVDTKRTLILRSVSDCDIKSTTRAKHAEWFFEDVVTHNLRLDSQKLWARQLDIENEGTHLLNVGSDLWILGYKTERGGTLVDTRSGGRTEILGGFSYTTTAGRLAPMFINDNSRVWAFFTEVCFNGDPFLTLVRETRGAHTKEIIHGSDSACPYSGYK